MRAIIIGRFQPFHKGHLRLIQHFLKKKYEIIIGIGSAQESFTPSNPFTGGERYLMISQALIGEKCQIIPIPDVHRYGIWVSHVKDLVPPFECVITNNPLLKELFSREGYTIKEAPLFERKKYCGSEIRERMKNNEDWKSCVPSSVVQVIETLSGVERLIQISAHDK